MAHGVPRCRGGLGQDRHQPDGQGKLGFLEERVGTQLVVIGMELTGRGNLVGHELPGSAVGHGDELPRRRHVFDLHVVFAVLGGDLFHLSGGLASIGPADGEAATQEFSIGAGSGKA
jgi:hypothetical protein